MHTPSSTIHSSIPGPRSLQCNHIENVHVSFVSMHVKSSWNDCSHTLQGTPMVHGKIGYVNINIIM